MRIAIKRPLAVALLIACALVTVGAGEEGTEMLEEFNRLLNILIFLAGVLAVFSLVWGAFTAMWDTAPHNRGPVQERRGRRAHRPAAGHHGQGPDGAPGGQHDRAASDPIAIT